MGKVEKIEQEVEALSPEELAQFRAWFLEYDWAAWDRQLERDVQAGRLTTLLRKPLVIMQPVRPNLSDSPRVPRFLGVLPVLTIGDSEPRRSGVCQRADGAATVKIPPHARSHVHYPRGRRGDDRRSGAAYDSTDVPMV